MRWADLDGNLKASGINIKWIANDNRPADWHLGGQFAGREGAIITGPVKGLVHLPFKGIWHEPAYGAPRFERVIDERREVSMRIALMSDSEVGWFDTEAKFWDGMSPKDPGFLSVFTHRFGELYIPMLLLDAVENELEDDPTTDGWNCQEWDIRLAADGEPRWRQPELRPAHWVNDFSITTMVKRDDEKLSPQIEVGVGKFKLANRGTVPTWPVFTLTAPKSGRTPARYWISNGSTTQMVRVPPLNKNEHITVDTNPENRIAIADNDPVDSFLGERIRNSELLSWLFGQYSETGLTILERFHGQGFDTPCMPGEVSTLVVYSDMDGARVSVRLPQLFERPIS